MNGQTINEWNDVLNTVKAYDTSSKGIAFEVLREGKLLKLNIHPSMTQLMTAQGSEEQRFTVGIIPAVSQTYAPFTTLKYRHPLKVLNYGVVTSLQTTKNVSMGILRLFQGRVSSKNVGGVITIGRFAGKSFRIGISAFLDFLAVISINLFIINLFPIPILDGGHLVFFSIEAIKGAPVSLKKMEMAQQFGLVILISLMAFAFFNDITNLFSTW